MANIKFSKKLFEKEIGKLDEKMQERISMFGTPLEKVNDDEVEIEVFPNRPDLLSYQGFKRSFLSFLGKTRGLKTYKIEKTEKDFAVEIDSSVKDVRPYSVCAIVKGLNFDDNKIKELIDLQEKLHMTVGRKRKKLAIGIYPLEKIKLPITYKALQPDKIKFVPLESEREMNGLEILQRHPTGRDYAHLLAGKAKFPVFVDASEAVLSMPPIINSELTGRIIENTKDVFIECSGFDLEVLKKCLNILVSTLADMGGKIYEMNLKGNYKLVSPDFQSEKIKISLERVNKLLGLNLLEKDLKIYLEKMGHNYLKGEVEVAPWRVDILHEVDIIEDIAIAYGYENFEVEIPEISTIGKENSDEILKKKIAEVLIGLGLLEVSNYHLISKNDLIGKMGFNEKTDRDFVEVENSKTEYNLLRRNLSVYVLKNFSENVDCEYPQKIFELGRVFELEKGEIIEKEKLSVGVTPGNFTEVRQILDNLFSMLGLEIEIKEPKDFGIHYIEGRVGEILFEKKKIGEIGEVHPKILKNWKIKMSVAMLEIDLTKIFEKIK
jgi:phenylalanyl-tRNA synthetase beta chain